jgi:hypothetical protein
MRKKYVLDILRKAYKILEEKKVGDMTLLKNLSKESTDLVAAYKDFDLISVTVLVYSIYKVYRSLNNEYDHLTELLREAITNLEHNYLTKYNKNLKEMYSVVKSCNAKVKEHLDDVMQAAKLRNSSFLLSKGLSMGQAAGLMGLSNWELQAYASNTVILDIESMKVSSEKRLKWAEEVFQ